MTFINLYRNNYKLTNMCAVLNISPKTYYKYRSKEDPDYYDYLIIKEIFDDSKGTYGYRVNVNLFCRFLVKIFVGFW